MFDVEWNFLSGNFYLLDYPIFFNNHKACVHPVDVSLNVNCHKLLAASLVEKYFDVYLSTSTNISITSIEISNRGVRDITTLCEDFVETFFLGYGVSQQATQHLYILGQYQFKLFDFIETHFVKNEI